METTSALSKNNQPELCLHCHGPVASVEQSRLNGPSKDPRFCCAGCHYVYCVLHDLDLDSFYSLRDKSGDWESTQPKMSSHKFEFLDDELFLTEHTSDEQSGTRVSFVLEGIHCIACIWLLEKLPEFLSGVIEAQVNYTRSQITVLYNPKEIKLSAVARMLHDLGYHPHPLTNDSLAKVRRRDRSSLIIKLAVAGVAAGNVMMMSVSLYQADYTGIEEEFRKLLYLACFLLSLPAVLYSAQPFYSKAIAGLKRGVIHIDLPVSLGILLGFFMSSYNALILSPHVYFDSICVLVFLLLAGRWLQLFTLDWSKSQTPDQIELLPQYAKRILSDGSEEVIYRAKIAAGDILRVEPYSVVPADGTILQGTTKVDNSIITGESRPVRIGESDNVIAGSTNLDKSIDISVSAVGESSRLGRLISEVQSDSNSGSETPKLIDVISHYFVPTVLSLAALCFVVWYYVAGFETAFTNSFALLIITCPCALGLAIPLSVSLSITSAAGRGLIIKNPDVFEPKQLPPAVFFDKTGTLTTGAPKVEVFFEKDSKYSTEEILSLVLAIEQSQEHPLALALEEYILGSKKGYQDLHVADLEYLPSNGVKARFNDSELVIGSYKWFQNLGVVIGGALQSEITRAIDSGKTPIVFALDGLAVAVFAVANNLAPSARRLISYLTKQDFSVHLLSGDLQAVVDRVACELGMVPDNAKGNCSPEDKEKTIRAFRQKFSTIMVGDGVNDALALKAADIGVAVSGGAETALKVADCYCVNRSLSMVEFLFSIIKRTQNTVRVTLSVSLLYNIVGASLAFMGYITPLMAAILMPLSSVSVIFLAYFGTRHSFKEVGS